ncbi:hypothetical protein [Streptomyces lavendofoliae]|uniref:hypothetical protein n=1 Tax=Streptomyces lavendofoliae TaxID=67314 RepID=UPI003D8A0104
MIKQVEGVTAVPGKDAVPKVTVTNNTDHRIGRQGITLTLGPGGLKWPAQLEGVVAKPGHSAYRGGERIWQKVRHTEVVDVAVIGYTGASAQPRNLAVRLPDGRTALSQRLGAPLANAAAPALIAAEPGPRGHTTASDRYMSTTAELEVEVASGMTRHAVVTVLRVRIS